MPGKKMLITIVIPAYNEAKRIVPTLENIAAYMSQKDVSWEIVISDDGSSDNTVEVIENFMRVHPQISMVNIGRNSGKGKAVREGMLKGRGDYVLFMDADSSTKIEEFEKFMPFMQENKHVLIGTRKKHGAEIIEPQPMLRSFFGKVFTWLSNFTMQVHVSDFTCGFKCFSRKAVKDIFGKALIDDWSFDAEILFLARNLNYEIIEVPVVWKNDRATKVRILRDTLHSLRGLFRIRLNLIKGDYR